MPDLDKEGMTAILSMLQALLITMDFFPNDRFGIIVPQKIPPMGYNFYKGKRAASKGGTHKTVLEMFLGNGVACGLCRFSVLQVIQ
ncbi:hypothetical protein K370107A2_08390 [Merdimmobilis hominis]